MRCSVDERAIPYGTPRQQEAAKALLRYGSTEEAAESMGITASRLRSHLAELRKRAAKRGWSPEHDYDKPVPEGFTVKGVSTYYGADGERRGQWVPRHRRDVADQALACQLSHRPIGPQTLRTGTVQAVILRRTSSTKRQPT